MTDTTVAAKTADTVDPNKAANENKDLMTSGRSLKAGQIPDSQKLGDQFGHVPPQKDGGYPTGTGTIPAVDNTTLTQMPHPNTLRGAVPNLEPFGREMNHPNAVPGENFVRDPQVFHTDPTSREDESDSAVQTQGQPLSSASISSAKA